MVDAGAFGPDARIELVDGELIDVPPVNPPHAGTVNAMLEVFVLALGRFAHVRAQSPLAIGPHSEPEPDLALVRRDARSYHDRHPVPSETFAVVEVAWSSLDIDQGIKLRMYARAGVREYWIMNLRAAVIEVYRDPHDLGYAVQLELRRGDTIAFEAFPDVRIPVDELLFAAAT